MFNAHLKSRFQRSIELSFWSASSTSKYLSRKYHCSTESSTVCPLADMRERNDSNACVEHHKMRGMEASCMRGTPCKPMCSKIDHANPVGSSTSWWLITTTLPLAALASHAKAQLSNLAQLPRSVLLILFERLASDVVAGILKRYSEHDAVVMVV